MSRANQNLAAVGQIKNFCPIVGRPRVIQLNDDSIGSHYFFELRKSNPNFKNLTLKGQMYFFHAELNF